MKKYKKYIALFIFIAALLIGQVESAWAAGGGTITELQVFTIDGSGNITQRVASTPFKLTGISDGCGTFTGGILGSTGTACGGSGSTPGGTSGQVQYNAHGTFGGIATTTLLPGTNVTISGGTPVVFGSSPFTINASGGGGSGVGTVSTSSLETAGQIAVWGTTNGYPAKLYSQSTSTLTASAPLTGSFTQIGTGGSIGCQTASGSQAGCLSATDWNTFNGKQAAGSYITALTGDATASGPGSVALTLATVNGNVGTFTYPSVTVNAKGLITAISNGSAPTTYTATYPVTLTGAAFGLAFGTTTSNTWAGTQTFTTSPVFSTLAAGTVNSTGTGSIYNTPTSTPTVSGPITYSGTLGQFIAGASGAFGCTTAASGVAGCLNSTDWATFNNKISSTSISITTTGGSGASTYTPSTGVFNIPQYQAAGSGTSGNCVQWGASNTLGDAGAPCGSGGGATFGNAFNFVSGTPNYLIGTTSPLGLIMTASSTIGGGTQANGLTINGGATTTGNVLFNLGGIASSTFIVGSTQAHPAFQIYASTTNAVTGLQLTSNVAGGGVNLGVISSGANEGLTINSAGTGAVVIRAGNVGGAAGQISLLGNGGIICLTENNGGCSVNVTNSTIAFTPPNNSSNATPYNFSGPTLTDTVITTKTEVPLFNFNYATAATAGGNGAGYMSWTNGVVPQERAFYIHAPALTMTSYSVANSFVNAATFGVDGPPVMSTTSNATTTNAFAIEIGSSTPVTTLNASTTNAYGLGAFPPAGAVNNYTAWFGLGGSGGVGIGTAAPKNALDVSGSVAIGTYAGANAANPSNSLIISGNLGVGTTTPVDGVDIYNKSKINIIGDGSGSQLDITKYTANASGNSVIQNKSRGSQASPSTVLVGDTIGANTFEGYGSTGFDVSSSIIATVGSTASGDNISGILSFLTANSSGVDTTALTINDSQNVGIGSTSPTALLSLFANTGSAFTANKLFDIASSTATATTSLFSVSNTGAVTIPTLGTPAGTFIAADPTGKLIATTSPSGGGVTSLTAGTGISLSQSTGAVTVSNTGLSTILIGTTTASTQTSTSEVNLASTTIQANQLIKGVATFTMPITAYNNGSGTTVPTLRFYYGGSSVSCQLGTLLGLNSDQGNITFTVVSTGNATQELQVTLIMLSAGAATSVSGDTCYLQGAGTTDSTQQQVFKITSQFSGGGGSITVDNGVAQLIK